MNAAIKEYILLAAGVSVLMLLADFILLDGNLKKYALFTIAIILTLCLVKPVLEIKDGFTLPEMEINEMNLDYTDAVRSTVTSVKGYEDASVFVETSDNKICSITVRCNSEYVLEETVTAVTQGFLVDMLSVIYGVEKENIYILE